MALDELTRGERTRLTILEAAQELFLQNGYQGTSMRQIAERAGGIAVGGIYNHFGSKEELFHQLILTNHPFPLIATALEEAEGESGPELLANALTRVSAIAIDNIEFIQFIFIDIQEFDGATIGEVIGKLLPVILAFARRVAAAGGLRADVNPFTLMRMFASLMIGFALTQRLVYPEGRPRIDLVPDISQEAWVDALVDVYLYGVAERG